ncbi:helix-turn-helix transcriptional regulator [Sphingomonas gilva]|nr:helix-turn-helix transcriptional regulator [Sphingomonas gilva]
MDTQTIGQEIRRWRTHRRRSQLDLALDTGISTRHLSFVETGRARPSRDLILNLAEQLDVPPRGRNAMLLQAGFAPVHGERGLDDAAMAAARAAISHILAAFAPFPALVVDRHWTMVEANAPVLALMGGVAPELLAAPVNPLRLSLHPDGLAPRIANLPEWRASLFRRLEEQIAASGDEALAALLAELRAYPGGEDAQAVTPNAIAIPLLLDTPAGRLSLISMTSVFGSPLDVTLSELAIESFLPADAATLAILKAA